MIVILRRNVTAILKCIGISQISLNDAKILNSARHNELVNQSKIRKSFIPKNNRIVFILKFKE